MARKAAPVEGVYEREAGSGRWYARYWQDGKKVRKAFGRDRVAAIAYLEKARTLKRTGEGMVPSTAKKAVLTSAEVAAHKEAQDSIPLSDLCDGLLKQIQSRPEEYKDQLNPPHRIGLIKKAFGRRPTASIKAHEISDWYHSLDAKPATKNRYRAVFSSIYAYGKGRDMVPVNPVRDTKPCKVNNAGIRYLLPSEETKIRNVLQSDVDACGPRNDQLRKHMIHRICELDVALDTGMRESEQYGLTWDRVVFETKEIHLPKTKNGDARTVHMTKRVMRALRILEQIPLERKRRSVDKPNESPKNVVFGIRDNKNWWERAKRSAKVKGFRWHDLRHTFCSRLAQRGVSLKVIQVLAGHKTISITAKYAHLDKTSVLKGLAVLEQDDD
jgi:integrase